jgi:polyphosphate kinase
VPGLSENITVRSIIGRFLEHSRAYLFFGGQPAPLEAEMFIGSADWMSRNLNNRVETITPVNAPAVKSRIWETLGLYFEDTQLAWQLQPEGDYLPLRGETDRPGVQELLMAGARERARVSV